MRLAVVLLAGGLLMVFYLALSQAAPGPLLAPPVDFSQRVKTPDLVSGQVFRQPLPVSHGMMGQPWLIDLRFATYRRMNTGAVWVRIEQQERAWEHRLSALWLRDGQPTYLFVPDLGWRAGLAQLELRGDGPVGRSPAVWAVTAGHIDTQEPRWTLGVTVRAPLAPLHRMAWLLFDDSLALAGVFAALFCLGGAALLLLLWPLRNQPTMRRATSSFTADSS